MYIVGFIDAVKKAAKKTIGKVVDWAEEKTGYDVRITEAIEEKPEGQQQQQQPKPQVKQEQQQKTTPVVVYKENGKVVGYEDVGRKMSVMGEPKQKNLLEPKPVVAGTVEKKTTKRRRPTLIVEYGHGKISGGGIVYSDETVTTTTATISSEVAKKFSKYHPEFKFKEKVTPEQVKQDIEIRGGLPPVDEAKVKAAIKQAAAMQKAQQIINTGVSKYFAKTANTMFVLSDKIEEGIKRRVKNKHLATILTGYATMATQTVGMAATVPVIAELAVKMPKETAAATVVGAGFEAEYIAEHPIETAEKLLGAVLFAKTLEITPKVAKEIKTRLEIGKELKDVEGVKYNPLTGKVKILETEDSFGTYKPKTIVKEINTLKVKEGNIIYASQMFEAEKYSKGAVKVIEYKKPIFKPTAEIVESYKKFYGSGAKLYIKSKLEKGQALGWVVKQVELGKNEKPITIKKWTEAELEITAPVRAGGRPLSTGGGSWGWFDMFQQVRAGVMQQLMKTEVKTVYSHVQAQKVAGLSKLALLSGLTQTKLQTQALKQLQLQGLRVAQAQTQAQTQATTLTQQLLQTQAQTKLQTQALKQLQLQGLRVAQAQTQAQTQATTLTQQLLQTQAQTKLQKIKTVVNPIVMMFSNKQGKIQTFKPAKRIAPKAPKVNLFGAAGKREYPVVAGKKAINILFGNKNIRRKRRGKK